MSWCNLTRIQGGAIICAICLQPYTLTAKELERWGGDLSKSKRSCYGYREPGEPKPVRPKTEAPVVPPLLKRIGNFTKAAITHAMAKAPTCTQEEIDARHAICKGCELYKPDAENPEVGVCTHSDCGCTIKRAKGYISKLGWRTSKCPLGKWPELVAITP